MAAFSEFDPARKPRCKVELHVHLDGAVRLTTVWELAQKKGIDLHVKTLEELYDICCIKKPSTLGKFLQAFHSFQPVFIGDLKALYRMAYEFCEDAAKQGVIYFEARYSPHLLSTVYSKSHLNLHGDEGVTPRMVVRSITLGLQAGERDFLVKARSILCCIRGNPDWSKDILELCIEFQSEGVVGIDLAGDEYLFPANEEDIAVFKEAAVLGIHRTVHCAEAGPASNVLIAVNQMFAERIGHGYHVFEDPNIYDKCVAQNIHFETCPYSSILTGSVILGSAKHPIVRLAEDVTNFSISRDDPTVIQKTLDEEYDFLKQLGLQDIHFTRANFNAARSCFLSVEEKQELLNHLRVIYCVNTNM